MIRTANRRQTVSVVVNGSPGPMVIGRSWGLLGSAFSRHCRELAARASAARSGADRSMSPTASETPAAAGQVLAALAPLGSARRSGLTPACSSAAAVVEKVEQQVVLPEAEAEGHGQRGEADEQPSAQLVEVVDDAQAILVADGPENPRHGVRPGALLGFALGPGGPTRGRRPARWSSAMVSGDGPRLRQRGLVVVVLGLAGDPFLELTHPRPQALAYPRAGALDRESVER